MASTASGTMELLFNTEREKIALTSMGFVLKHAHLDSCSKRHLGWLIPACSPRINKARIELKSEED